MNAAEELRALELEDVQSMSRRSAGSRLTRSGSTNWPTRSRSSARDGTPAADGRARSRSPCVLAHHFRGVHMSRLVEALHAHADRGQPGQFRRMIAEVRERLDSDFARVELRFPYFLEPPRR